MQTRASLLVRIRNLNDGLAWSEFVKLYTPLLHSYGMKHGLQDADAADVAQETIRLVMRSAPDFVYDPSKGTFRGWLFSVARNEVRKFINRKRRTILGTGDTDVHACLDQQPTSELSEDEWDHEYQLNLIRWAAEKVRIEFRDTTWNAFWRTVMLHQEIDSVARELNLSVGAVYIARSRVTARIRQEISAVKEL